MTQDQHTPQTFVMLAMGLVTGALAIGLYKHVGLPGPVAAIAAVAIYVVLLTFHALLWRTTSWISPVVRMTKDRRDQQVRRLKEDARQSPSAGPALSSANPAMPRRPAAAEPALQAPRAAERAFGAATTPPPLPPGPTAQVMPEVGPAPTLTTPPRDDNQDYWSYRPAAPRLDLPPFVTGRVAGRTQASATSARGNRTPDLAQGVVPPPIPNVPLSTREADVEVIQDAIKRLLEEVNATEQSAARARSAEAAARPAAAASYAQEPSAMSEAAIESSLDALRMTAQAMRSATDAKTAVSSRPEQRSELQPPPLTQTLPPPLPPMQRTEAPTPPRQQAQAISPSQARARVMSDAISAGRIDVRLEPILGLEDQQTRHYEVSVRLRDAEGNVLDVMGDGPDLRGTGLLPLFDSVSVARTAVVARRLEERGKGGSVFSAFSGESVADERFLGELAETLHQRSSLAAQLVLSFTQADVRGFAAAEWDSLADMRALGFRFALSAITDLDMDFEALAEQGFAFVKLDADVFLSGLPTADGHIPSSDVCRHLAKLGLTLVVEHIDDEDKLARVFGFGVLLGQGHLFGGPRPVRADVVAGGRGDTAAA